MGRVGTEFALYAVEMKTRHGLGINILAEHLFL